jgi:hypothetical protein
MVLMHATRRTQYPMIEWLNGIRRFVNIKQETNEPLSDYFKRFCQEYDMFKAQFGDDIFDTAAMKLENYTSAKDSDSKEKF